MLVCWSGLAMLDAKRLVPATRITADRVHWSPSCVARGDRGSGRRSLRVLTGPWPIRRPTMTWRWRPSSRSQLSCLLFVWLPFRVPRRPGPPDRGTMTRRCCVVLVAVVRRGRCGARGRSGSHDTLEDGGNDRVGTDDADRRRVRCAGVRARALHVAAPRPCSTRSSTSGGGDGARSGSRRCSNRVPTAPGPESAPRRS